MFRRVSALGRPSRLVPALALAVLASCESTTDVPSVYDPSFAVGGAGAVPAPYLIAADGLADVGAALHGQWGIAIPRASGGRLAVMQSTLYHKVSA